MIKNHGEISSSGMCRPKDAPNIFLQCYIAINRVQMSVMSSQRELFLSEINNRETIAAIEGNNDMYGLRKRIEKFPLHRYNKGVTFLGKSSFVSHRNTRILTWFSWLYGFCSFRWLSRSKSVEICGFHEFWNHEV